MHTTSPLRTSIRTLATQAFAYGAVLLAALTVSRVARAQAFPLSGRVSGAIHLQVTDPRGEFSQNTGHGFGVGVSGILRGDQHGVINLRTDLSLITYGTSTRRIPFANTGGLVKLDLRTTSSIVSLVVGPQIGGTAGPVSMYVAGLAGFSVFWTESSVEGSSNNNNQPFASTTNASDAALAYGASAGGTFRVYNGQRPVRLDFGARYLRHDDATYLNEARVQDAFSNNRDPIPLRGRADFVTYYVGANVVLF